MPSLKDPATYLTKHYVYEVNMLRAAHRALATAKDWTLKDELTDQAAKNALIESFCVHARALLDFYKSTARGDDVVATNFIASGKFAAATTSQLPGDIRDRVNKQIAHLTESRENANWIDADALNTLLVAIETDHAAFRKAVEPQFAGCFTGELQIPIMPIAPGSTPSATNVFRSVSTAPHCGWGALKGGPPNGLG
jgi:hypothetical protein